MKLYSGSDLQEDEIGILRVETAIHEVMIDDLGSVKSVWRRDGSAADLFWGSLLFVGRALGPRPTHYLFGVQIISIDGRKVSLWGHTQIQVLPGTHEVEASSSEPCPPRGFWAAPKRVTFTSRFGVERGRQYLISVLRPVAFRGETPWYQSIVLGAEDTKELAAGKLGEIQWKTANVRYRGPVVACQG